MHTQNSKSSHSLNQKLSKPRTSTFALIGLAECRDPGFFARNNRAFKALLFPRNRTLGYLAYTSQPNTIPPQTGPRASSWRKVLGGAQPPISKPSISGSSQHSTPSNQHPCMLCNASKPPTSAFGLIGLADWGDPGFFARNNRALKALLFPRNRTLGYLAYTSQPNTIAPQTGPRTSSWRRVLGGAQPPISKPSISSSSQHSTPSNQNPCMLYKSSKPPTSAFGLIGLAECRDPGFFARNNRALKALLFPRNRTLGYLAYTSQPNTIAPQTGPGASSWRKVLVGAPPPISKPSISSSSQHSTPSNQHPCMLCNASKPPTSALALIGLADWGDPGFFARNNRAFKALLFPRNRTLGYLACTSQPNTTPPQTGPGASSWRRVLGGAQPPISKPSISGLRKLINTLCLSLMILSANSAMAIPMDKAPETTDKKLQKVAAKNAFDMGLLSLAERLYTEILANTTDTNEQQTMGTQLASILINQSKYKEALTILNKLPKKQTPTVQLLNAIASFQDNQEISKNIIDKLNPKLLPSDYLPWFYITKGLIAENNNNPKEAKNFFKEAQSLSLSEDLKSHIDTLLFRIDILSDKASETLEKNLEKKLEKSKKNPTLIKQYALVLNKLGKKEQAIDLLESTLSALSSKEKTEFDSLNFLIALIATPDSEKGRLALESIIEKKQNLDLSKTALSTLTHYTNHTNAKSYLKFLTSLIDSPTQHPLIDSLLINRAHLALFLEDRELAQTDSSRLLEDFPGSIHIPQAMRILAYSWWTSSPPHYRTAADILSKLAEKTKNPNERAQLTLLVADSYFLNQDFSLAAKIYTSLLEDSKLQLPKGHILYQLILSLINQKDTPTATTFINKFRNDPFVDSTNLWRAEWNLINSMKNLGQINQAFSLIRQLTLPSETSSLDLKLRLIWLHAQLALESGKPEQSSLLIDSLLALLQSSTPEILDSEQIQLITSHALLLKAQSLLQLHQEQEALSVISTLRTTYPETKSATLSYLIEARYYSSLNNPTKAQQELINLADNFPKSNYAPIALYEAALNAESRSLKNTYQEALSILERLISNYPDSPLAYNARFKQADILRKLGNFSDAHLIYENLLKQNPNHPQTYPTKLASIDSLFAQYSNTPPALPEIASSYYQLLDLPTLSPNLRAEAGFKSGFASIKANQANRAQETLWLTLSTLLLDPSINNQLDEQGRYWIARSIFELGALFEKSDQTKEANEVYQLILSYKLPGIALANSKIK